MSVAIAIGLVITALALPQLTLVALRSWRVARRPCPHCRRKFGATAASISSDYYERRYGAGVRVFDGPRRYRGARVVTCQACQAESVFGELSGFVEPFEVTEAANAGGRESEWWVYGVGGCLYGGLAAWLFVNSSWPVMAWLLAASAVVGFVAAWDLWRRR